MLHAKGKLTILLLSEYADSVLVCSLIFLSFIDVFEMVLGMEKVKNSIIYFYFETICFIKRGITINLYRVTYISIDYLKQILSLNKLLITKKT